MGGSIVPHMIVLTVQAGVRYGTPGAGTKYAIRTSCSTITTSVKNNEPIFWVSTFVTG